MQAAPAPVKHPLPTRVQQAILDYGFADKDILKKVVASRQHGNWFAALVHDAAEDYLWAIEFQTSASGGWEIVNDETGPFESVQAFYDKKLITSLY